MLLKIIIIMITGSEDSVFCYNCGGHLSGWIPSDDPWTMHAWWFPNCTYLKLKKGQQYIDNTILSQQNHMGIDVSYA
jgi:hypothetical protein